jgi:succinate dehydrogenase / fumarate reductase membrane anchor subunit
MSSSKSSIRTPLGRVRGLGSARAGTGDFWRQRLTAVALVLLIVPAIIIIMMMLGRNHAAATQILGSTSVAIVLMLFTIASVWHMKIGMQVVIEDYVHDERLKLVLIIANNFFSVGVALAAIYAILKLSFGV